MLGRREAGCGRASGQCHAKKERCCCEEGGERECAGGSVARAACQHTSRGAFAVARAALRWPRRSQWVSGGLRGASEGGAGCAWRWQGRLSAAAGAESGHGNSTRGSWRGARVRRRACDLRFACDLMAIEWAPCRRTTRRDDGVVAGGGARAGRREVARKRAPEILQSCVRGYSLRHICVRGYSLRHTSQDCLMKLHASLLITQDQPHPVYLNIKGGGFGGDRPKAALAV